MIRGRGFDFRPFSLRVTTLAKLYRHVLLSPTGISLYWPKGGDTGLACRNVMAAYRRFEDCRMQYDCLETGISCGLNTVY